MYATIYMRQNSLRQEVSDVSVRPGRSQDHPGAATAQCPLQILLIYPRGPVLGDGTYTHKQLHLVQSLQNLELKFAFIFTVAQCQGTHLSV